MSFLVKNSVYYFEETEFNQMLSVSIRNHINLEIVAFISLDPTAVYCW